MSKIKATNPYSGESEMLTPEEHKLYIEIKTAEFDEDYNTMQKGLRKFQIVAFSNSFSHRCFANTIFNYLPTWQYKGFVNYIRH